MGLEVFSRLFGRHVRSGSGGGDSWTFWLFGTAVVWQSIAAVFFPVRLSLSWPSLQDAQHSIGWQVYSGLVVVEAHPVHNLECVPMAFASSYHIERALEQLKLAVMSCIRKGQYAASRLDPQHSVLAVTSPPEFMTRFCRTRTQSMDWNYQRQWTRVRM